MAIVQLQTPRYQAPTTNLLTYGQAGGTPQHQFFQYEPGRTVTLDAGFNNQRQRINPEELYGDQQGMGMPSMSDALISGGVGYLANDAGINAGNFAYEKFLAGEPAPSIWQQGAEGFSRTGQGIADTVSGIPDGISDFATGTRDFFLGAPTAPDPSGFGTTGNYTVSNSILGPQPVGPQPVPLTGAAGSYTNAINNIGALPAPSGYSASIDGLGAMMAEPVGYSAPAGSLFADTAAAGAPIGNTGFSAEPTLTAADPGAGTATGNIMSGAGTSSAAGAAAPGTAIWSGGDFMTNLKFGGLQSAAFGGVATLGLGLLMGQDFKTAAKSAAGSAAGTALGFAIGGPIGGFLGGTIGGSVFCYAPGTPIEMHDGTTKNVEDLELHDRTLVGGKVTAKGEALCDELFEYKGNLVSGAHAVFENGFWLRVRDSDLATHVSIDKPVRVIPVCNEHHILVANGVISADLEEVVDTTKYSDEQRIQILNHCYERNEELFYLEVPNRAVSAQCSLFEYNQLDYEA